MPRQTTQITAVAPKNREQGQNSRSKQDNSIITSMPSLPDQAVRDLAHVFRLLCDETRLRIVFHLAHSGELHVNDLCSKLDQSQPFISNHLSLLRVANLVESRREGKYNFYSIRTETFGGLLDGCFSNSGPKPKKFPFDHFVLQYLGKKAVASH